MHPKTSHLNGSLHDHGFCLFNLILLEPTLHFTGQAGDVSDREIYSFAFEPDFSEIIGVDEHGLLVYK